MYERLNKLKITLFVILAIIQVVIALLPSLGRLYHEENGVSSYKTTIWGKTLLVSSILGLLFTIGLYLYSENKEGENKQELKNELAKRDSLSHLEIEQSKNETIEALAKYGLKYDSAKKEIITFIKGSTNAKDEKTVIGICPSDIGIVTERISDKEIHLDIRFCNFGNNPAYKVNITAEVLVKKDETLQHNEFGKSPYNLTISNQTTYVMKGKLNVNTIKWTEDTLYLFLKGVYSNYQNTSKQIFRELYVYDYTKNQWGLPPGRSDLPIIETLKSSGFY